MFFRIHFEKHRQTAQKLRRPFEPIAVLMPHIMHIARIDIEREPQRPHHLGKG